MDAAARPRTRSSAVLPKAFSNPPDSTSKQKASSPTASTKRTLTTPLKRNRTGVKLEDDDSMSTPPSSKRRRSTPKERSVKDPYNPVNNLVDSLRPGLTLVFIGLNPGLMTASTGTYHSIYRVLKLKFYRSCLCASFQSVLEDAQLEWSNTCQTRTQGDVRPSEALSDWEYKHLLATYAHWSWA